MPIAAHRRPHRVIAVRHPGHRLPSVDQDLPTWDDTRAADVFDEHRRLLTSVAYRVLGRWSDAEDVVQDAWLRWSTVDIEQVENPEGYLVRVTTRLAIDRLRSAASRRETYVGPWLPEPILTAPDVADDVAHSESV